MGETGMWPAGHKPLIGPASHHTSKATDPRIPGVSAGGDGAEPPTRRERVWIIPVAIAVIASLAIALFAFWFSRGDSAATDALASQGVTVHAEYADLVTVSESNSGAFMLFVEADPARDVSDARYSVEPAAAGAIDAAGEGWEPFDWPGAEAYTHDADLALAVGTDAGTWGFVYVTAGLTSGDEVDAMLAQGWTQLARLVHVAGAE